MFIFKLSNIMWRYSLTLFVIHYMDLITEIRI